MTEIIQFDKYSRESKSFTEGEQYIFEFLAPITCENIEFSCGKNVYNLPTFQKECEDNYNIAIDNLKNLGLLVFV